MLLRKINERTWLDIITTSVCSIDIVVTVVVIDCAIVCLMSNIWPIAYLLFIDYVFIIEP